MKYFLKQIYFGFAILLFFCSCGTVKNSLFVVKNQPESITEAVLELQKGSDSINNNLQTIKPGDQLLLTNLKSDVLISATISSSNTNVATALTYYVVENDSNAVLPVIGKIKLGGLSRKNAEIEINKLYEKVLLKNPLLVLSIANLSVTLLGDFTNQGNLPLKKEQTHLVEIIADAGGLPKTANSKKIKIIRGNPANPKILLVDLTNINSLGDKRLYLQNKDIIYVEATKSAQNAEKFTKTTTYLGIGLTLVNTIFLIYNFTK